MDQLDIDKASLEHWIEHRVKRGDTYRAEKISQFFPKDVETCIDIGPGVTQTVFRNMFKEYRTVDLANADYVMDLLYQDTLPVPDKSFDLVILSHVLEHLPFPERIAKEALRVSRKYVYVALPNEYNIFARIRMLFGIGSKRPIHKYGHKYFFSVYSADVWIKNLFGPWLKKRHTSMRPGNFHRIVHILGTRLVKLDANLFADEIAYVFSVNNTP